MIAFPILRTLTIEKYGLLPISKKEPFVIEFSPGQNAIVGVNGSGKTTLINIALRCLTGPFNLPAPTSDTEFGQVRARFVTMSRPERTLFARRVADGAKDATATLVVSFGSKTLEISRRLSDLSLIACTVKDQLADAATVAHSQHKDDKSYQAEIAQCVGVASFFDTLIIFHFLSFMLEDRRALVWDPTAQRQIFRVLLLPEDRATEYASAQQEVISKDSAVRNIKNVIKRQKGEIVAAKARAKTIKDAEAERRVLTKEANILREQIEIVTQE